MSNTTSVIDETAASHDAVTVTRQLTREDEEISGTIEIQPTGRKPVVLVHVVDEFPEDLPIDAVGFHPDGAPEMGNVTPQRASIEETVETEPVRIEYGIKLAEPVETVQFDPPTIQGVETAEMTRSTAAQTDGGEPASGSADGADESSTSVSSFLPSLGWDSAGTEGPEDRQSLDAKPADPATESSEPEGSDGDGIHNGAVESAIERVDEPDDGEHETTVTGPDSGEGQTNDRNPAAVDRTETRDGSSVIDSEPRADAEMAADESDGATNQRERRSTEVRVDRLSARVEEFAAYASALEDLIDEHGTAPEFLDRTERELADLDSRVRSVREEVSTIEDTHGEDIDDLREEIDTLDERIDDARRTLETDLGDVRERVGDVSEDIKRIDTGLADQGSAIEDIEGDIEALDGRVTGVEGDIEAVRATIESVEKDVAAVSDDVREMREELRSLGDAVEDLNEFRDSLAHAFGTPADTPAQSDD